MCKVEAERKTGTTTKYLRAERLIFAVLENGWKCNLERPFANLSNSRFSGFLVGGMSDVADPLTRPNYVNQGKYDDAEPVNKRSLAIHKETLDPQHPHMAESLNNMAEM